MESRIRSIFLGGPALAVMFAVLGALPAWAQDGADEAPQVIEPKVERRDIDLRAIDTEDWEVTGFLGWMSIEDFESDAVYGARIAYHINDKIFTELSVGTADAGESSVERADPVDLLGDDRDYTWYDLSFGYSLLPGEVFFGADRAYNSAFYLIGGLGSTDFGGDNQFTLNYGFGVKVLVTDYLALRAEFRDYLFDLDVTGEDKTTHNMQGTFSISYFF